MQGTILRAIFPLSEMVWAINSLRWNEVFPAYFPNQSTACWLNLYWVSYEFPSIAKNNYYKKMFLSMGNCFARHHIQSRFSSWSRRVWSKLKRDDIEMLLQGFQKHQVLFLTLNVQYFATSFARPFGHISQVIKRVILRRKHYINR